MIIVRRLVSMLVVIWLAATLVFIGLRMLPGDAIRTQLAQSGASAEVVAQRRAEQGLDQPLAIQYLQFLVRLGQGNLGVSLIDGQPVVDLIARQWPATIALALAALNVGVILGLALGVTCAFSLRWGVSTAAHWIVTLALSTPVYWTGTLAIFLFAAQWRWLPASGAGRFDQLILPAGVLGLHTAGAIARVIAASVREVQQADFVRTARAKGLPERSIMRRHILRVGLLPAVQVIALQAGFLLGGTVITESLFVRPGIGRLLLDRTLQQDYPVVQGIAILSAIVYTAINTLADFVYPWLDPRVRQ